MLRACHRVLKSGGVIAFSVIVLGTVVDEAEAEMAIEAGPPYPDAGVGYEAMMEELGFVDIDVDDVGEEFLDTTQAWIREWDAESDAMKEVVGTDEFDDRQAKRRLAASAIDRGLLRRFMISGRRA